MGIISQPQGTNLPEDSNSCDVKPCLADKTVPDSKLPQDIKTRLIQRQGCIQHAVISQSVFSNSTNPDEWWALCEKTADKMIEYINRE